MVAHGIPGTSFGPVMWHTLHMIAMAYPEHVGNSQQDIILKNDMYNFFKALGSVIPCESCRDHYVVNFEKMDQSLQKALDSRVELSRWVYDLHNEVNVIKGIDINDRSKVPSFADVYKKYSNLCSSDCDSEGNNFCSSAGNKSPVKCKVEFVTSGFMDNLSPSVILNIILLISLGVLLYFYFRRNNGNNFSKKRLRS